MNNLEKIIIYIYEHKPKSKVEFDELRRKICGKLKISQPANHKLLLAYQKLLKNKSLKNDKQFEFFLRKAQIRTLSGVAIITSLTKPYNCPGDCVYCPTETKMPKSYLSSEPAAARALALKFDPYEQMRRRIMMLEQNGHPTDKIEFIIKGGTWNAYPLKYQYWFILESFRACNDFGHPERRTKTEVEESLSSLQRALREAQRKNEKAKHRIIGLTLETRPDAVNPTTIFHMRQMGCTRIELGLQAPDDKILKLVDRGHTVKQFKDAMLLLRQAGFKVDLHFMPDLPGTTPKHDLEMYKLLFSDPGFKPDMIKIYPCTVIKSAKLYKWYKAGRYKPYSDKKLFETLIKMKTATPRYCRISRLIRDIPNPDIEAGNAITNLREELKKEMSKRGLVCHCLRCREVGHIDIKAIKHKNKKTLEPKLFIEKYKTTGGTEYFLSFEDNKRQVVFAFLRLRLPNQNNLVNLKNLINLENLAFIRELHTYGQLVNVGKDEKTASQHKGLGKKMVAEAEKIAKKNKYQKIAVISGVGVRDYYRKLGYKLEKTYMTKKLV